MLDAHRILSAVILIPVFLLFYISVSAANAQGFAPARLAVESFGWGATAGGWSVEEHPRLMGDVNGDGRADIVGFGESGTVVSLGQPDGSLTPRVRVLDNFGAGRSGGGWGGLDGPARTQPRHLADVNGDGRDDIIGFGVDGTWVALAQSENPFGETFGEPRRVLSSFGADAAAGGWGEVLQQKYEIYPRLLGDVNGDGQADIVGFHDRGVWVALATGDGGFAEPNRVLSRFGASPAAGGWEGLRHPRLLGDVNGDGRADIVGFGESGTLVSLGHADGTFTEPSRVLVSFGAHAEAGNWAPVVDVDGIATVYPRLLGDVNGDDRSDIIGFGNRGTSVALGQPDGSFSNPVQVLDYFGAAPKAGGYRDEDDVRLVADVNGDGRDDIVGMGPQNTQVSLSLSNGTFSSPFLAVEDFGRASGADHFWSYREPRLLADVNGDGRADIIGFREDGAFVAVARGPVPGAEIVPTEPVGWNEGEFAVTHDGAATYTLPLWVPEGRGGLKPELALSYSSIAGNGPLGMGWSLNGLSTITPCARTIAQDGDAELVRFDGKGPFCLDGNRLIPVTGEDDPVRPGVGGFQGGEADPDAGNQPATQAGKVGEPVQAGVGVGLGGVEARRRVLAPQRLAPGAVNQQATQTGEEEGTVQPGVGGRFQGGEVAPGAVDQEAVQVDCIEREYRTERDAFAKIVAYCGPTGAAPEYFRVWTKDGRVLTFGEWNEDVRARRWAFQLTAGPDLRSPSLEPASETRVPIAWALNRVEDRNGNAITFEYRSSEAPENLWATDLWLHAIRYDPSRTIRFYYEPRPDVIDGFVNGVHARNTGRLNRIAMYVGSSDETAAPLREYRLAYEPTESDSISGRSLLSSIEECVEVQRDEPIHGAVDDPVVSPIAEQQWAHPDAEQQKLAPPGAVLSEGCLSPLEFRWSHGSNEFRLLPNDDVGTPTHFFVADVNGDGRDDVVYLDSETDEWQIVFSRGTSFSSPVPAGIAPAQPVHPDVFPPRVWPVDIDRDGRMDVVALVPKPDESGYYDYYAYRSTGRSFVRDSPAFGFDAAHCNQTPRVADLDGNGLPDIATVENDPSDPLFEERNLGACDYWPSKALIGKFVYWRNAAGSPGQLSLIENRSQVSAEGGGFILDYDGDGREELLVQNNLWGEDTEDERYQAYGLNRSGATVSAPSNLRVWRLDGPATATGDADWHAPPLAADVNGDGLSDVVWRNTWDYPPQFAVQLNSGRGFSSMLGSPRERESPYPEQISSVVLQGDFNHDGRIDFLSFPNDEEPPPRLELEVWQDSRFGRVTLDLPPAASALRGWASTEVLDFDGDGMLDLVQVDGDDLRVLRRRGGIPDLMVGIGVGGVGPRVEIDYTSLADARVHEPGACTYPQHCPVRGGQIVAQHRIANGIGEGWNRFDHHYSAARVDLLGRGWLGFAEHTVTEQETGAVMVTEFDNTTRYVGVTAPVVSIAAHYPFARLPSRTTVTVAVDADKEYRRVITNTYEFRRLAVSGTYTVELTTRSDREYERYFVAVPFPDWSDLAPLRSVATSFAYDPFGNPTSTQIDVEGGRSRHDERVYRNNADTWLIGQLVRRVVRGCTADAACRSLETTYGYDANGNLQEILVEPTRPELMLRTVIERTRFGNISLVTASDAAGRTRSQSFAYGEDGVSVAASTNALGHTTRYAIHDGLGVPLAITDPNDVTLTMSYDGFGRIREVTHPDGKSARVNYLSGSIQHPMRISTSYADGNALLVEFDQLGREQIRRARSFGGEWSSIHTTFDPLGRVTAVSRPFPVTGEEEPVRPGIGGDEAADAANQPATQGGEEVKPAQAGTGVGVGAGEAARDALDQLATQAGEEDVTVQPGAGGGVGGDEAAPGAVDQEAVQPGDGPFYWTRYTYDMLGRLVSRTDPDFDEATVRHEYVESKTHAYDAKGAHSYVVETRDREVAARYEPNADATGWLMSLFEHGPFGEVTRGVAADGTEQTMAYDLLGRRIGHTDPDAGATTSAFNAFGELVDVWDAEGRHTHFEYDDLGRLLKVASDDGTATFRRDEAEHGIDRIAEARSADGVVTRYAYDALARPVTMTWEIEGESYEVGVSYDEFGRLSSVAYPEIPGAGRFAVAYAYDAFGYLSQVTNATDGTLYWQAETRNAAGQLEAEGFGNGLATTRTYYPETGLLERLATADPVSGRTLHVLAYTYDLNRNVASRSEAVSAREETYAYDALNRLVGWSVSNGGALVNQVTYAYDDLGDLTAEVVEKGPGSDVIYRYGENGAPPHALTSRGADRYAYDGSGRQIGGPGRTVDYNGLDLPRVIEQNGVRTEFAYDVDGARVLKRGGGETVASIPGLYDRRTGNDVRHVYHIVADGRTVAQVTQVQAAPGDPVTSTDVAYLHGDLHGTVGWVSDAARQVSDELRYDPFGRRIDAAFAPLPDERRDGVRLGFTGHEHDDELGLINMKGRIYDPALRRFLTPDPFIEAPLFSQSHNRYSYVWNNPATFVDPTGFQREGEPNGAPLPLDPILGSDDWLSGSGEEPLEVPGETIFTEVPVGNEVLGERVLNVVQLAVAIGQGFRSAPSSKSPVVFWSGGAVAMDRAAKVAAARGGSTIADTLEGQLLNWLHSKPALRNSELGQAVIKAANNLGSGAFAFGAGLAGRPKQSVIRIPQNPESIRSRIELPAHKLGQVVRFGGNALNLVATLAAIDEVRAALSGVGPQIDIEGFDCVGCYTSVVVGYSADGTPIKLHVVAERNIIGRQKFYVAPDPCTRSPGC